MFDDTALGVACVGNKVGMRHDAALAIENVAYATLADFQFPHKVPDKLETDLDNAHAGVLPRASKRQRHIGFRLTAQIDRTEVDPAGLSHGEFRVLREI